MGWSEDVWDFAPLKEGKTPILRNNDSNMTTMLQTKEIASAADLKNIKNDLSGVYVLTTDIDISESASGTAVIPGIFKGTLKGNGHQIIGQKIPLFDTLDGATIENVKLVQGEINQKGTDKVAALAKTSQADTLIKMDIHFGRIKGQDEKAVIKAIDYNKQAEEGLNTIYEEDARKLYRKWDNVKHISEALKENGRPRKVYQSGLWGLSIKTKERLDPKAGRGLRFGIVVTLREMNGENRIDDFIKMCMMRGWIVNRLDVQAQADVYFKAEEEITFE